MNIFTRLFLAMLGSYEFQPMVPPCPIKKREKEVAAQELQLRELKVALELEALEIERYGHKLSKQQREAAARSK